MSEVIAILSSTCSVAKDHCHDSIFTANTLREETELIPSKSLSPALDSQRVLRLVKEVPRSLNKRNKIHVEQKYPQG